MMPQLNEAELVNLRESVACNLCGNDVYASVYQIDSRSVQLKTLWLDNVEYDIHSQEMIVRCTTCSLVYVNPRLAENPKIEPYSTELEAHYFANTRAQRTKAFSHVIDLLPTWLGRNPCSLLDIGCGDGLMMELGQAAGIDCSGTEQSMSLRQQIRDRLGDDAIVPSDITRIKDECYDVVSLINVIEHLRHPKEMLIEIHRLLKPDGILLIHAPNLGGIPARAQRERWNQIEPFEHFYYFTLQTLTRMLVDSGFEPVERFGLFTATGLKDRIQRLLANNDIYVDNGLGVVSRRLG